MPPFFGSRPDAPEFPVLTGNWGFIPPFVNLHAQSFRVSVDHSRRRICVAGIIRNLGNVAPKRAVKVAIGVTVVIAGQTRSQQEIFTIEASALQPGAQVETDCSTAPLVYLDEDSGAKYVLELLVDITHESSDIYHGDNYLRVTTWWTNPENQTLTRIGDIAAELESHKA